MQLNWKHLLAELAFWLATEIVLNAAGWSDLANYSEFVFKSSGLNHGTTPMLTFSKAN